MIPIYKDHYVRLIADSSWESRYSVSNDTM